MGAFSKDQWREQLSLFKRPQTQPINFPCHGDSDFHPPWRPVTFHCSSMVNTFQSSPRSLHRIDGCDLQHVISVPLAVQGGQPRRSRIQADHQEDDQPLIVYLRSTFTGPMLPWACWDLCNYYGIIDSTDYSLSFTLGRSDDHFA